MPIGRLLICVVLAVIYPFSSTIYPTVVRGSSVSLASACARLGAISYGVLVPVSYLLENLGLVGGIYPANTFPLKHIFRRLHPLRYF